MRKNSCSLFVDSKQFFGFSFFFLVWYTSNANLNWPMSIKLQKASSFSHKMKLLLLVCSHQAAHVNSFFFVVAFLVHFQCCTLLNLTGPATAPFLNLNLITLRKKCCDLSTSWTPFSWCASNPFGLKTNEKFSIQIVC